MFDIRRDELVAITFESKDLSYDKPVSIMNTIPWHEIANIRKINRKSPSYEIVTKSGVIYGISKETYDAIQEYFHSKEY